MTTAERVAAVLDIPASGVWSLALLGAFLVVPTTYRILALRRRPGEVTRGRVRRVGTWWALFALLCLVLAAGRGAVVLTMLAISLLALRESLRLAASPGLYRWLSVPAIGLYAWLWSASLGPFLRWLPVALLALAALATLGHLRGGIATGGRPGRGLSLALFSSVVGPSYAVGVATLPAPESLPETGFGWLVLLLILTGVHDSAQAWWGRTFGSRPLAPVLSPNKTLEGLWGGLATTAMVSVFVAPTLTPFGRVAPPGFVAESPAWIPAAALGLVTGLAGTAGDLAASALKRAAGVDDSGDLVPGHGGVLDRFDSLAATAPVFFFASYLLWFRG
ncbi:MAG: phosphatidate cytidylyltransferase [Gemmatimonadota bacterium]